ncbi:MAG: hypothetical protein ACXWRE_09870 [Pseudobdellovibrionaceae bacterium]
MKKLLVLISIIASINVFANEQDLRVRLEGKLVTKDNEVSYLGNSFGYFELNLRNDLSSGSYSIVDNDRIQQNASISSIERDENTITGTLLGNQEGSKIEIIFSEKNMIAMIKKYKKSFFSRGYKLEFTFTPTRAIGNFWETLP